jgi:hypothetical protein
VLHEELVWAKIVEAGKNCRRRSALQEVDHHQHQAVARDGAVASVVDVVEVRPELDDESQRTETPIH